MTLKGSLLFILCSKKSIELHRFIYSLGIIHVGEETAIALEKFISAKKIINKPTELLLMMEKISVEDLQEIPDIGPKVATSIYQKCLMTFG